MLDRFFHLIVLWLVALFIPYTDFLVNFFRYPFHWNVLKVVFSSFFNLDVLHCVLAPVIRVQMNNFLGLFIWLVWKLGMWSVCVSPRYTVISNVSLAFVFTNTPRNAIPLYSIINLMNRVMILCFFNRRAFHNNKGVTEVSDPKLQPDSWQCTIFRGMYYGFDEVSGTGWTHRCALGFFLHDTTEFEPRV